MSTSATSSAPPVVACRARGSPSAHAVPLLLPPDRPTGGGAVRIGPAWYTAELDGRELGLSQTEFELLSRLAPQPLRAPSCER
ncbi:predicted protein [Streptomyces viridosporus ATCC 14672]|uniref:Predicted protein n=1 Tax=Streptomyces viridosporus (strain ATCC 14672 / DSM 40746 / JCM 4963 / KCTC 9882 / NRRL B-12104 / FH 1290) TaxID=566461 RepID=D5ZYC5_STRV1|nr:predicted protein [Streptomyces viridosporus ATCC 14672]